MKHNAGVAPMAGDEMPASGVHRARKSGRLYVVKKSPDESGHQTKGLMATAVSIHGALRKPLATRRTASAGHRWRVMVVGSQAVNRAAILRRRQSRDALTK